MSRASARPVRGEAPPAAAEAPSRAKPGRSGAGRLAAQASDKARRTGCVILEVLAGLRTPKEASEALGLSQQRFYTLEARAIEGLVAALEPRPRGRQPGGEAELARLREEREQLQRELQRSQALVRAAQRTIGVQAARTPTQRAQAKRQANAQGKRGPRQPAVRARQALARLRGKPGSDEATSQEAS